MDDAPAILTSSSRLKVALGLTLAAAAGAALVFWIAPRRVPSLPLYEARAERIAIRGRRADAVEAALRQRYAERVASRTAMSAARVRLHASLADRFPPGPLPGQSRAAACAAELRGAALVLEGLASHSPVAAGPAGPAPETIAGVREGVLRAARAGDAAALDAFVLDEQGRWRAWIADRARALPPESRDQLWSEWAAQFNARARELETQAAQIENFVTPFQLQMVPLFARLRALALEPGFADPSRALIEFPAAPRTIAVRPVFMTWALLLLGGALLGLAIAGAILGFTARRPRRMARAATVALPVTRPAWLQVVAGRTPGRVARAVCELSARALARAQRVVVIEASPKLNLHRGWRLSPRLGWSECAVDGLPALGLLQNGGFTGLFLLAYGRAGRVRSWLPLDRVLEELRPHFGCVVLALDGSAPAEVGSLLAGRVMDGWWAGGGPATGSRAESAGARLSILLRDLDLKAMPQASLESLEQRLQSLGPPPEPLVPPAAPAPIAARPEWVSEPAVLESDLQLRQRLHFLAWMRRLQAQQRGRERETAAPV
jgi:hypothetical protein